LGAGGNTFIGGGEAASELFTNLNVLDGEDMYLAATNIYMYTNTDAIANKKLVLSLNANGTITLPGSKTIDTSGNFSGNAATATKLKTARTISLTGSVTGSGSFDGSGNLSIATTTNHTHSYLPLAGGGTLTGSAVINFPAGSVSVAASTPMSLSYGRLACYGTLCINANTDNSGTEYVILTAGKGLSSSAADGLAIGTSTLTW
jgi:hypothetical protein